MDLQDLFKPDLKKITMFLILFAPTSMIPNFGYGVWWTGVDIGINYGFPFNFYGYGGGPPLEPGQPIPRYFSLISIVGNALAWYVISCALAWVFHKAIANRQSNQR